MGDPVGTTLGAAGRSPLAELAGLGVEPTEVPTRIVGVPDNVVGSNGDAPGATPRFGRRYSVTYIVFGLTLPSLGLFRSVKKGTPSELTAIRVGTRVRRERIEELNLVTKRR